MAAAVDNVTFHQILCPTPTRRISYPTFRWRVSRIAEDGAQHPSLRSRPVAGNACVLGGVGRENDFLPGTLFAIVSRLSCACVSAWAASFGEAIMFLNPPLDTKGAASVACPDFADLEQMHVFVCCTHTYVTDSVWWCNDVAGNEGVWDCVSPNAALFYVKTMNINAQHFTKWEVEYQGTSSSA